MARPTNTFSTFEAIGNREDLKDFIENISPTDCPFTNGVGKAKAQNVYFEWQTDALAAPNTSNAQIEADDTTVAAVTPTVRVGNRTQISNASVVISRTQETVQKAGRSSELAYQITKKTKELKRDIEAIVTQNQASAAGNTTTARKTGSLEAWITTNRAVARPVPAAASPAGRSRPRPTARSGRSRSRCSRTSANRSTVPAAMPTR
ncbi:MAG: hypothetical protein QOK29_2981 [Rhodospirillaceae bacterium]|nr:hypothetical protein [Rhodospirillaceae bacterium]